MFVCSCLSHKMFGVLHSLDLHVFPYIPTRDHLITRKKALEKPLKTIHFRHVCSAVLHKENPCPRIVTPVTEPTNPAAFTVDYLINSCGLSPAKALSAATKICISHAERPNSVISLFHDNGFSKTQISQVVCKLPTVLLSDPDNILKPKLEFFRGLGLSDSGVGKLFAKDPSILNISLENHIIPTINLLRSYVGTDENVLRVIGRSTWVLRTNSVTVMEPNIAILRDYGVPDVNISKLLLTYPQTLAKKTDKFMDIVEQVQEIGFDASRPIFCYAVRAMAALSKEKWEKKIMLFQSFGWSEDEVFSLFKRQPGILTISEKKLQKGLKFFMDEWKWTREDMSSKISILFFNLEKTIIPRCEVLDTLISRGVEVNKAPALVMTEKRFVQRYVNNYRDFLPELMEIYTPLKRKGNVLQ